MLQKISSAKEVSPCVLVIDDAFDNPEEIINKAKNLNRISEAEVVAPNGEDILRNDIRNTKTIDISPNFSNDSFWWLVSQRIWQYGNEYAKMYNISFIAMDNPQFLLYEVNQGFYKAHHDDIPGIKRIFSSILYLNDVVEGGETHFERFNLSISPKAGRLVFFPAGFSHRHGANIPISNDKYAIVTCFIAA